MRILQIANFVTPTSGGQRIAIEALAVEYTKAGHLCSLITPGTKATKIGDVAGRYHSVSGVRVPFSGGYRAILRRNELREAILRINPDVVELADKTTLSWVPEFCNQNGIKCVLFSHEKAQDVTADKLPRWLPTGFVFRKWRSEIENHVNKIICASNFSAEEYKSISERVEIVPLGVDHQIFKSIAEDDSKTATPTLIYVGRLSVEKRPYIALAAIRELSLRGIKLKLQFIGNGPMRRRLEAMANGLDVEFLGQIKDRHELAKAFSNARLTISPAPFETFGLSVLESLACGTPVIVANTGAGRELVEPNCGEAVDPSGVSVADAIQRILNQPAHTISPQCIMRASGYSWQKSASTLLSVYSSLLNETEQIAA